MNEWCAPPLDRQGRSDCARALIFSDPFTTADPSAGWSERGTWPCRWIGYPLPDQTPLVMAYRLRFTLDMPITVRVHVTADERYELFVNGDQVGRGPERGDPRHWCFETYDLQLDAGAHVLVARVWALGDLAPLAQFSLQPGFLLCPELAQHQDLLGTGRAAWEVTLLDGYSFTSPMGAFAVGHNIVLDGTQATWDWEQGLGDGWLPARTLHSGYSAAQRNEVLPREHLLTPALLPPMLDEPRQVGRACHISAPALSETHALPLLSADHLSAEESAWNALLQGRGPLTLPPHTRRRIIIDLEDYYCAYPEAIVSGGEQATLRIHWQESLFIDPRTWERGERDVIEGRYFTSIWWHRDGLGDCFRLDGGQDRRLRALWWQAGRYVEILVETSNQPLTIDRLTFRETRYPLVLESSFTASDERLARVVPIAFRALQMCAHETYADCPYFEQLMYVGDTRLECLITYATTHDDRLPRKVLRLFDHSRLESGLTQSRYPSRLRQIIPPFSLWWVAMVHDYLLWRGDLPFVRSLLVGVRAVLDAFTVQRDNAGFVRSPEGWNYVDWVQSWEGGIPPGGEPGGICGPINWQYVYALSRAAEIEEACGEPELAARCRRLARETIQALTERYWNAERELYADDPEHTIFTEHSQCLAVLSGLLPDGQRAAIARRLFSTSGLTTPTVYFMHYFFETCRELGRIDVFLERMTLWFEMEQLDFKTTYENADPRTNRSDCHAWGAHPLYHYFASILGIRPASPGFATVAIMPQLGSLQHASGRFVHPRGEIVVDVRAEAGVLRGSVDLPQGVTGTLQLDGATHALVGGYQAF